MRKGDPFSKVVYDDSGRTPSEHHVFVSGGDIYTCLLAFITTLVKENHAPTKKAYFIISPDDLDDLFDIYLDDPIRTAFQMEKGKSTFAGVWIRTPEDKPKGWWPE